MRCKNLSFLSSLIQWRLFRYFKSPPKGHQNAWACFRGSRVYCVTMPRPHMTMFVLPLLQNFKGTVFDHSLYSPDVSPSDYLLITRLKKTTGGKRFTTRDEFVAEIESIPQNLNLSWRHWKAGETARQILEKNRYFVLYSIEIFLQFFMLLFDELEHWRQNFLIVPRIFSVPELRGWETYLLTYLVLCFKEFWNLVVV